MASNLNRFRENHAALLRINVSEEARVIYPNETGLTVEEGSQRQRLVRPPDLVIRGLTRAYGIVLFNELNKNLNPFTSQNEDLTAPLQFMDEATLASIEREPIQIRSEEDSEFDILLEESEPGAGRFDLEIKKGPASKEDAIEARDTLHSAFNAVMSEVELTKVSLDDYGQVLPEAESMDEQVEVQVPPRQKLSAINRSNRVTAKSRFQRPEAKQFSDDVQEIKFLMEILGIDGADEARSSELVEFWKNRGRDHIAIIDLFMFVVERKRELHTSSGPQYHVTFEEMKQYGGKKPDQIALRRELEDKSLEHMSDDFRMLRPDASHFLQSAQSELDKLRLRYVTWLASYPDLVGVRRKARELFMNASISPEGLAHILGQVYEIAVTELDAEADSQEKTITDEAWSTFGGIEYYKDIPTEVEAYNDTLNFYRTASLLGRYLFTMDNMDEYLRR